jgi:hypothetical protein
MSTTRSGTVYNSNKKSRIERPVSLTNGKTNNIINNSSATKQPAFFEPRPTNVYSAKANRNANNVRKFPLRETRTQFSKEMLSELCAYSDNDSTSTYDSDDAQEEEEYQRQYDQPKYEVNIDFDEASEAWRANKRKVGESWVYKKENPYRKNAATNSSSSVASRLVHMSTRSSASKM